MNVAFEACSDPQTDVWETHTILKRIILAKILLLGLKEEKTRKIKSSLGSQHCTVGNR